jgi:integrase/recombinase XerD
VNAVISMNVKDYFTQGRRGWVRLHEKGGKAHEVPCHHMLEKYLDEYLAAAEIAADTEGPLFRTTGQAHAMWQQDAYRMIQRRLRTHQDQNRQPHVPCDRNHTRLPQERVC